MEIIPRTAWGARHPNGCTSAPLPAVECWLHHSVTTQLAPTASLAQEHTAMRALEDIGQQRFGCGISYTWLIFPSGRVYEGHSPNRQGTHTGGRNDRARAICFVGNYETNAPTTAQIVSAAQLLQHVRAQRWLDEARLDGGHRDLKATSCPGALAYAQIPTINQLAAGPPITEETDDMYDPAIDRPMLQRIHDELTQLLGSRSQYAEKDAQGNPVFRDTAPGYAVNADARGHEVRVELGQARTALEGRIAAVEQRLDVLPEQLDQVVRQAMADVVDVRVSVVDGDPVGS